MRAGIKYLSIGLFIGVTATGLWLTWIFVPPRIPATIPTNTLTILANTYTPRPTLTRQTATASTNYTATVTPTNPSPTQTVSDALMGLLQDGYLSQVGPLSLINQIKVYEASLKYVGTNTDESRLIGEQINGIGYGSPSNICGPLSIAILQDAGLIDSFLIPYNYWLLNADLADDRRLLSKAFPPEQFESIRINTKLDEINWKENRLYPGDFIYLYAGYGGNFEHMLVINRVDAHGSAYAVTNHRTPSGFIISEVLLYDPADPEVGMFPAWTARENNAETGSTGFAGFEVWRSRSP